MSLLPRKDVQGNGANSIGTSPHGCRPTPNATRRPGPGPPFLCSRESPSSLDSPFGPSASPAAPVGARSPGGLTEEALGRMADQAESHGVPASKSRVVPRQSS